MAGSSSAYNKHIAMWEGQTRERSKTDTRGEEERDLRAASTAHHEESIG
jgi:hypothetical protein